MSRSTRTCARLINLVRVGEENTKYIKLAVIPDVAQGKFECGLNCRQWNDVILYTLPVIHIIVTLYKYSIDEKYLLLNLL